MRQKTVTLTSIEKGVRILYDFSRESDRFRIPVEYTITEEGFEARIDFAGIEEYGDSLVTSITLLPYFGSVGAGTGTGYLFVPDGSGSVLAFDSAISTSTGLCPAGVWKGRQLFPDPNLRAYGKNLSAGFRPVRHRRQLFGNHRRGGGFSHHRGHARWRRQPI